VRREVTVAQDVYVSVDDVALQVPLGRVCYNVRYMFMVGSCCPTDNHGLVAAAGDATEMVGWLGGHRDLETPTRFPVDCECARSRSVS